MTDEPQTFAMLLARAKLDLEYAENRLSEARYEVAKNEAYVAYLEAKQREMAGHE